PLHRAALMFLTPTEIKGNNGQLLPAPDFAVLLARIRDRIGALRTLYGEGPLEMDHRAFAERAAHVRMRASELQQVNVDRFSTRTGQRHPLGGFIGTATYEGDLQEFAPYLHAASFTGVGRQTVWGKGEIALRRL
ncbi:MAG: CRISPR system precrRNA processing endoribonuclease RAMP protein Cas6, partial [Bryobacterales bacterium]|nr:CRISPR system precrRNA processing endoribonuclease RAMP protein Cas6 [Bryobacterales bacterium]